MIIASVSAATAIDSSPRVVFLDFVADVFVVDVSSFLLTAMTPAIQSPRYRIVDMETLDPRKRAPSSTVNKGYE